MEKIFVIKFKSCVGMKFIALLQPEKGLGISDSTPKGLANNLRKGLSSQFDAKNWQEKLDIEPDLKKITSKRFCFQKAEPKLLSETEKKEFSDSMSAQ